MNRSTMGSNNVPPKFYKLCRLCLGNVADCELGESTVVFAGAQEKGISHRKRQQNGGALSTVGSSDVVVMDQDSVTGTNNDAGGGGGGDGGGGRSGAFNHQHAARQGTSSSGSSSSSSSSSNSSSSSSNSSSSSDDDEVTADDDYDNDDDDDNFFDGADDGSNVDLAKRIRTCLAIKITPKDGLPTVVCSSCRDQLETCHRFRRVAYKTQKSLQSFLSYAAKLSGSAQEILSQSSEKLEHLIASSPASLAAKASAEQDAIAALQALRNNNNHTAKSVTSVLSKTHLQNLEANSVSVIPIESMKITSSSNQQLQQQQHPSIIHHQTIHLHHPTAQIQQQHQQQQQPKQQQQQQQHHHQQLIQVKNLTQLQQEHLETAAVLMDISKK